eukprot:116054-Prymnesium_polylepis.1
MDMFQIVQSKGYAIERHYAVTPDEYILGMFRIPSARGEVGVSTTRKPAVLIMHGLLMSSFAFVANSPNQSLGFLLADRGFDVWLGNNRGNAYSTNHTMLSVHSSAFWDFTYDEMASLDLPTHLEYVLSHTGCETLSYIGHSQGTIQAFAGFPQHAALASRVNLFVAMAPVAFVHHLEVVLLKILAGVHGDDLVRVLGVKKTFTGQFLSTFAPQLCRVYFRLVATT